MPFQGGEIPQKDNKNIRKQYIYGQIRENRAAAEFSQIRNIYGIAKCYNDYIILRRVMSSV